MSKKKPKLGPEPFFKKSHQAWYVQAHGKQHRLGKVLDDAAKQKCKEIVAKKPEAEPSKDELTVAVLVNDFLASMAIKVKRKKLTQRTLDWYDPHLQSFAEHIGTKLTVTDLKPAHLQAWLDKRYAESGNTHQNGAVRAVARVFNSAKKSGIITRSPIADFERPEYEPRECYLKPDQWKKVAAILPENDPFTDFVWFLYLTGCRPWEARTAKDSHYDREDQCLTFERKNSKGKKWQRYILLEEKSLEIVERCAGDEYIFTNSKGKPWTAYSLNCRFKRLRAKLRREVIEELGLVEELTKKLGKKPTRKQKKDYIEKQAERIEKHLFNVFPYIFRHTWITNALKRGLNPLTVAELAGHRSAAMILQVYSHLCQDREHLREQLRRAVA